MFVINVAKNLKGLKIHKFECDFCKLERNNKKFQTSSRCSKIILCDLGCCEIFDNETEEKENNKKCHPKTEKLECELCDLFLMILRQANAVKYLYLTYMYLKH